MSLAQVAQTTVAASAAVKAGSVVVERSAVDPTLMMLARIEVHARTSMNYAKQDRVLENVPSSMEIAIQHILNQIEKERQKLDTPDTCHPTHVTRSSDASTFDEVCENCGARDIAGGGWGRLRFPCLAMIKATMP